MQLKNYSKISKNRSIYTKLLFILNPTMLCEIIFHQIT